MIKKLLDKGKI